MPNEHLLNSAAVAAALVCVVAVLSGRGHGIALLVSLALYRAIADNGEVFLSFQWEQLLIETGYIALVAAPWLGHLPGRLRSATCTWLLRFLLCKVMFMSGVVKLQADCPTWTQLTATQYHYATQPLPTAAAQLAHFMPAALHKVSVAVTLILEIPATVMLLVPLSHTLALGCMLQVLLQVLILLTGNYTFFNLLTLLLAVTAARGHTLDTRKGLVWLNSPTTRNVQRVCILALLWSAALYMFDHGPVLLQQGDGTAPPHWLWHVQVSPRMLGGQLTALLDAHLYSTALFAGAMVCGMALLCSVLPPSRQACSAPPPATTPRGAHAPGTATQPAVTAVLRPYFRLVSAAAALTGVAAACNMLLLSSMGALLTLHTPTLRSTPLLLSRLQTAQAWRMASGYGLFRVMTGVARAPPAQASRLQRTHEQLLQAATTATEEYAGTSVWPHFISYTWACLAVTQPAVWLHNVHAAASSHSVTSLQVLPTHLVPVPGWTDETGVPIPVVARPEIQLQGRSEAKGGWQDVSFRYKPGGLSCRPALVAPHQPRLDWQMWFAALGAYNQAPWAVLLQHRLLQASPHVMQLLASPPPQHNPPPNNACGGHWPFGWKASKPPLLPKADLTVQELVKEWPRWLLPPVALVHPPLPRPPHSMRAVAWEYDFTRPSLLGMQEGPNSDGWHAQDNGTVWRRRGGTEWLPELTVADESLQQFVQSVRGGSTEAALTQSHARARAWCRRVLHRLPSGAEPCVRAPVLRRVLSVLGMAPDTGVDGVWLLDWWLPLHLYSGVDELLPAPLGRLLQVQVPVPLPMYGRWQGAQQACFAVSPNQWRWLSSICSAALCWLSSAWAVVAQAPSTSLSLLHPLPPGTCSTWACWGVTWYAQAWYVLRWVVSAVKSHLGSPCACLLGGFLALRWRWGGPQK